MLGDPHEDSVGGFVIGVLVLALWVGWIMAIAVVFGTLNIFDGLIVGLVVPSVAVWLVYRRFFMASGPLE